VVGIWINVRMQAGMSMSQIIGPKVDQQEDTKMHVRDQSDIRSFSVHFPRYVEEH
jgi:hypothetical protein